MEEIAILCASMNKLDIFFHLSLNIYEDCYLFDKEKKIPNPHPLRYDRINKWNIVCPFY